MYGKDPVSEKLFMGQGWNSYCCCFMINLIDKTSNCQILVSDIITVETSSFQGVICCNLLLSFKHLSDDRKKYAFLVISIFWSLSWLSIFRW